jgi:lysophospholipase L1-like esterase
MIAARYIRSAAAISIRKRKMRTRLLLGVTLALGLSVALASTALAKTIASKHYYLALGDSLSVGYQPDQQGTGRETNRGYTNDLSAREAKRVKHLQLVEVGCPGDTTTSLLTGKGNDQAAKLFHCDRKGGSQLKAAVAFLKAHHKAGEVPLLTIDIGANDVDSCAGAGNLGAIATCVSKGEATIKKNTPKILNALKHAAPKGTHFVAMNLYDPVLGEYFSTNSSDKSLAELSVSFVKSINGDIQSADQKSSFKTADVAAAFKTYDQSATVSYEGQMIPVNVAYACAWTWACTTPPVGPNIHANDNGYTVISQVFYRTVGRLS